MGVTIYRSTDPSAPTLSGTAGDLVTVLDAILVNGYGSKPAAGWTKTFSGKNKAAYRLASGAQTYLQIWDAGPGAGGGKEARIRGYETMTDVDNGSALFPTYALLSTGIIARKSTTADATTRTWFCAADYRTVHFMALTGDIANVYHAFSFGEFASYVSGDQYNVMIIGRATENNWTTSVENIGSVAVSVVTALTGHYIARNYTGTGGAISVGKHQDLVKQRSDHIGVSGMAYAHPADGRLWVSPVWIHETAQPLVRGYMRGVWAPLHAATNFNDGDTFNGGAGTPDLTGKVFEIKKTISNSGGTTGCLALESSNTWS